MRSVRSGGCGLDDQCRMPSLHARYEIRKRKEAGGGANNRPAEKSGIAAWLGASRHDTWEIQSVKRE